MGLRGGVSLAAALALPLVIAGGKTFPERDLLIFLTFCVILATLVVQGLSLGPLIRLLNLKGDTTFEQEHAQAHLAAIQAAQARLDDLAGEEWVHEDYLMHLRSYYEEQARLNTERLDGEGATQEIDHATVHTRLRQEVLKAERAIVIRLRDQGHIDDEVLRLVERELDLEEQRLQGRW